MPRCYLSQKEIIYGQTMLTIKQNYKEKYHKLLDGSIKTFTGKKFYPMEPDPNLICIEDIAHSLSNKCRFSGHTKMFYSVAQHSIIVSNHSENKLWGLIHDASEAYLVDLPTPLKVLPEFSFFYEVERKVTEAVCLKFGLTPKEPDDVSFADKLVLITEKRDLMDVDTDWEEQYGFKPLSERIVGMPPELAKQKFLTVYKNLTINL